MNSRIDILLKKLSDDNVVMPPDRVWSNIERSLDKQSKRKWFLLLFLIVFAVLICVSAFFYNNWITKTGKSNDFQNSNNVTKFENQNNAILGSKRTDLHKKIFKNADTDIHLISKKYFKSSNTLKVKKMIQTPSDFNNENYTILKNTESENSPNSVNSKTETKDLTQLKYLNKSIHILKINSLLNLKLKPDFDKVIKCPEFSDKRAYLFIEGGLFGGYHIKNIKDGNNAILAEMRRETDSDWYSWGAYGMIGYNISKHFYIATGVDYVQSKDKFNKTSSQITKMIITFDAKTGAPIDTSFLTGNEVNKGEIRYNMIDIPLTLGYNVKRGSWDIGVELSPLYNLKFTATGKIIDQNLDASKINLIDKVYKSNIGFGVKASLVAMKMIAENTSVVIKPTFRTYLNRISYDGYSLPTYYYQLGINIGVRHEF